MKVVFMGTPEFSVPTVEVLHQGGFKIQAIYSQPPRPTGRGHKIQMSATHTWGVEHDIPVLTPLTLKGGEETLRSFDPDVIVVVAYGLILPQSILDIPKQGCLNVHGSLLPRWRGAAPIHRALMAGDLETGITIMGMEAGLDTGPMYKKGVVAIDGASTLQSLHDELAMMGGLLLVEVLRDLDQITPKVQPMDGVTYAHKIQKDEGVIDWNEGAEVLERKVRALNPWPGVTFQYKGEKIKVMKARVVDRKGNKPGTVLTQDLVIQTGVSGFQPLILQRPGGKPLETSVFLKGYPIPVGTLLGSSDAPL